MVKINMLRRKTEAGFTLIELLIVVVVVGIISSIAVIGYTRSARLMRDQMTRTRLFQIAEAQSQYRTALGRRRFGTLAELAATITPQGALVPESVLRLDGTGASQAIDNWVLEPTPGVTQDAAYLRHRFDIIIRNVNATGTDPIYCIHEDAVERAGTASGGCTRTSPPVER